MQTNAKEAPRFDDVRRRLQTGDVFQPADHVWSRQGERWRGTCPFCDSDNKRVFTVETDSLRWHCHHCERGGGPLHYAAERENVGMGARGSLKGENFFRAWDALSEHAGCEEPPELDAEKETENSDRRPLRSSPETRNRTRSRQPATAGSGGSVSRDMPFRRHEPKRRMKRSEKELREALLSYREALKESDRARQYVEARGLSVETLREYGCGCAAPGEWVDDHITNDNGTHAHRAPNGRIVTPHTTARGDSQSRLVCLSGRAVPPCDDWLKKRHVKGNDTALFNAAAIATASSGDSIDPSEPLVICEGPFDALSFIEAGWQRAIALHNTKGVPWDLLRGNAETLVFAFDHDEESETGQTDAPKRAREAVRRGFEAHTLHDEDSYAGHGDPNDALQAGELTLDYLEGIGTEAGGSGRSKNKSHDHRPERAAAPGNGRSENKPHDRSAEGPERPADGSGPKAGQSPASQAAGGEGGGGTCEPADLAEYWNGTDVGHLGRWLWERGGVPEGDVGAGLYADRELHEWIEEKLEAGPQGTSEQTKIRLRWVLWRLYAAHGPEEVPARQIPIPPMRRA